MAKATKSLKEWCLENRRTDILSELDMDKNSTRFSAGYIPDKIEYNSPHVLNWKCENGHSYTCETVGRTLFDLKCPICYPKGDILHVGTSYGCLTTIDDFDHVRNAYKCQCDCGKTHYKSQQEFLNSKHRFCTRAVTEKLLEHRLWELKVANEPQTEENALKVFCGLAVKKWLDKNKNSKRVYAPNYDVEFTGRIFESLEILGCIDDKHEERSINNDLRKRDAYKYIVYKKYRCRCYLCGKEYEAKCSQFSINPPTSYGSTAYNGYWSDIKCKCHKISSFQWIVNKLLFENNIHYRVEYSFSDLYGIYGKNQLKFDFAILNNNGSLKCLIECQGEHHSGPVEEFGGEHRYNIQVQNDALKKEYCKKHNIVLIEIPHTDKQIDNIESILRAHNII